MPDFSYLLGAKPVDIPDPLQQAAKMMQVQNLASTGKLSQLNLQKAQQEQQSQQGLQQALPGLDLTDKNAVMAAMQANPQAAQAILKAAQDAAKNNAAVGKDQADTDAKKADTKVKLLGAIGGQANALAADPNLDPGKIKAFYSAAQRLGVDPQMLGTPDNPNDPNAWRDQLKGIANLSFSTAQQVADQRAKQGQAITMRGQDMTANTAQQGQQVTMRGQNMTDARSRQAEVGVPEQFSPDAITNAAARYNLDGTLPPMGMGKSGVSARAAILNKAADLATQGGVDPTMQRVNQLGNKADASALNKLSQQETMVGSFEKNFNMNADLALNLSTKVGNSGVPIANQWINAGKRAVAGNPELAAYDTAIDTTLKEYSKITSGAMGNQAVAEGEINKARERLNSAQTPEQVNAVIQFMKKETANRMQSFKQQHDELRTRMSGGSQPAAQSPNTQAPATRDDAVKQALDAISHGAPRDKVMERLKSMGYGDARL